MSNLIIDPNNQENSSVTISGHHLSKKLYGREIEYTQLCNTYMTVKAGHMALSVIAGYSGIGKSSLVYKLFKPHVLRDGIFISGKYDITNTSMPYSAIFPALEQFCQYLYIEKKNELEEWRKRILAGINESGQILANFVPTLRLIIGTIADSPIMELLAAKNRFHHAVIQFLTVICNRKNPVVIFLDDLQWADQESLELINLIMSGSSIEGLHMILAYRDNEVTDSSVLTTILKKIKKTNGVVVDEIKIHELTKETIHEMISDSLGDNARVIKPLVDCIFKKTLGNPLYAREFLRRLLNKNILFCKDESWFWDADLLAKESVSENVIDFMIRNLDVYSQEVQEILKCAACLGNIFDLESLFIACEKSELFIMPKLVTVIQNGLIAATSDYYQNITTKKLAYHEIYYTFQHDRILQAVYSLIPEEDQPHYHYRIGKLLFQFLSKQHKLDEKIFEVVGQLNKGLEIISDDTDKLILSNLNYRAGVKAREASSYQTAITYFLQAKALLPKDPFNHEYSLALVVYLDLARLFCINSDFTRADELFKVLADEVRNEVDLAKLKIVQMEGLQLQGDYLGAVECQKSALQLLNNPFPTDIEAAIEQELAYVEDFLTNCTIEALVNLPILSIEPIRNVLLVLSSMWTNAYLCAKEDIVQWISVKMLSLSLQHGISEFMSIAIVKYAYICVLRLKDYSRAKRLATEAIRFAEMYPHQALRGKVYFNVGVLITPWLEHIAHATELFRKTYAASIECGDWAYATYSATYIVNSMLTEGKNCNDVYIAALKYYNFIKNKTSVGFESFFLPSAFCPLLSLLGKTSGRGEISCEIFSESQFLQSLAQLPIVKAWYYSPKLRNLFIFRRLTEANALLQGVDEVMSPIIGQIMYPEVAFYGALSLTAVINVEMSKQERLDKLSLFNRFLERIAERALQCPDNFLHKLLLMKAELARINESSYHVTMIFYENAFSEAIKYEFYNIAALTKELKARYLFEIGQMDNALDELRAACVFYQKIGILEKIAQLREEFVTLD